MSRRPIRHRTKCAHPDCPEYAHFEYSTQREYSAHLATLRARPWRCVRHTRPDEVLSIESPARAVTLVAEPGEGYTAERLFWRDETQDRRDSGFVHGPGFKAYAQDFPPGTRLVLTVQIVPPTPEQEEMIR